MQQFTGKRIKNGEIVITAEDGGGMPVFQQPLKDWPAG
jgi:hypothetical protein